MLGAFCDLYNAGLQQRIEAYRRRGISLRYLDQANELKARSEEHTSELQSRQYLVCRLLLEKKAIFDTSALSLFFLSCAYQLCLPPLTHLSYCPLDALALHLPLALSDLPDHDVSLVDCCVLR